MTVSGVLGRRVVAAAAVVGLTVTISPVSAAPAEDSDKCIEYGAIADAPKGRIPRDDFVRVKRDPLRSWAAKHQAAARAAAQAEATTTVPVVFHVIRKDRTLAGGNITDADIARQIAALNAGFAGTGFQFDLVDTTRTTNASWFKFFYTQGGPPRFFRGSHKEIRVKRALHQGGPETLNVYSGSLGKHLLGWAYFASDFTAESGTDPLPRFYDGVVVDFRSLPLLEGAYRLYGEGDTLTHEVGHWLELFHTFQGGCESPGDRVDDTPYEASPSFDCNDARDTCPDQPGTDPVHNYMDYSPDACLTTFSAGQAARMRQSWEAFRATG